jgi:short-subunit dehydrogenase
MNIVVVGGSNVGTFGGDFVHKATQDGHTVVNYSYREQSKDEIVREFKACIPQYIDILIYNSNCGSYPFWADTDYHKNCSVNLSAYYDTLKVHVVAPHAISLCALNNMDADSHVYFMTTGSSLDFTRDYNIADCGYAGGKAWQTHLMLALAHENDVGATFSSISPHFEYGTAYYDRTLQQVYGYIMSKDKSNNGKIVYFGG